MFSDYFPCPKVETNNNVVYIAADLLPTSFMTTWHSIATFQFFKPESEGSADPFKEYKNGSKSAPIPTVRAHIQTNQLKGGKTQYPHLFVALHHMPC